MGLIEKSSSRDRSEAALALFYDERIRATFYQCLLFGMVSWGLWYLVTNTSIAAWDDEPTNSSKTSATSPAVA